MKKAITYIEKSSIVPVSFSLSSFKILLWRECQRHQDTNPGNPDSQSPSDGHTEAYQTFMELLGIVCNGKNHAYVLRKLPYFSWRTWKRLGKNGSGGERNTSRTKSVWLEGAYFLKNKPEEPIKRTSGGIFMLFWVLADSNKLHLPSFFHRFITIKKEVI